MSKRDGAVSMRYWEPIVGLENHFWGEYSYAVDVGKTELIGFCKGMIWPEASRGWCVRLWGVVPPGHSVDEWEVDELAIMEAQDVIFVTAASAAAYIPILLRQYLGDAVDSYGLTFGLPRKDVNIDEAERKEMVELSVRLMRTDGTEVTTFVVGL